MSDLLYTGVRKGGTTTGGASQTVAVANRFRTGLVLQNTSDTDMWVTETDVDAAVGVGYKLGPGGQFVTTTNMSIRLFCASASKTFECTEV